MILKLKSFSLLNDFQIECKSDAKSKKIRERLKELSQLLANWRLIGVEWRDKWNAIVFVFNSGLISSVYLNHNNCVTDVYHDRYLQNKLLSEHLVNVLLRDNYILVSYTLSRLTLVSLSAPNDRKSRAKHKLKNSNPVMSCIDLESGVTRRVERNLVANESGDLLIVWWRTGTNCVAPWSAPGRSLRDLANIFVYNFIKSNFALISLACISGHIYEMSFMRWNPNQVVLLQQSPNSANVLNYCVFEITDLSESLQQIYSIRIPLSRTCVRAQFTTAMDRVVLLLDDDTVNVFNIEHNCLFSLHSSVKAYDFACNPLDAIFSVADQFGRVSIYDYNLNSIHINYEKPRPDRMLTLNRLKFLNQSKLCLYFCAEKYCDITLISLPAAIDNKTLVNQYLSHQRSELAIACLQSINWNCYSDSAYFCLNTIFNHLIRQPLTSETEAYLETTLATFLTPMAPIVEEIRRDYKLEIHYMAKRFFYHLVRYNSLDKAFLLGIDLKSGRLFRHLHRIARQRGNDRIANAALLKAQQYGRSVADEWHKSDPGLEHNNNNDDNQIDKNAIEDNNSYAFETSPNVIGLPSVESLGYSKYKQSIERATKESQPITISSILKSGSSKSSSKTRATVVGAKPITFRHINPSDTYNKDIVLTEPSFGQSLSDPLYAISRKSREYEEHIIPLDVRNHSFLRHDSPNHELDAKPKFERASYSSCSSRCSSSSRTSTYSSTSASLSIPTPPSDSCPPKLPPKLPPKTYLTSKPPLAPERPPKNSSANVCNNAEQVSDVMLSRTEVDHNSSVSSVNAKSSSKIECIHFGVV